MSDLAETADVVVVVGGSAGAVLADPDHDWAIPSSCSPSASTSASTQADLL